MKQTSQKTRNGFWADFSKFAFIFVILVVAVFSVKYSGILDPDDPVDTTSSSRPPAQSTPDTPGPTDTPPVSGIETTYPIATLPSQSGGTTSPLPPINTGILPSDITDEKMNALITQKYLSINSESRSGEKLTALKNIVVHYVGNPGTSAMNNWRYFESAQGVSAHFIIGLDGEILQCMPLDEVAWAVGTTEGNYTSISIECCLRTKPANSPTLHTNPSLSSFHGSATNSDLIEAMCCVTMITSDIPAAASHGASPARSILLTTRPNGKNSKIL